MDEKFNMFIETVDERFRSFVNQINEYLIPLADGGEQAEIHLPDHDLKIPCPQL